MRYNTGNPVGPDGSSSPFDLNDNAGIADQLVTGDQRVYPDRLGRSVRSFTGMNGDFDEAQTARSSEFSQDQVARSLQFQQFLISSGYQPLGDYAAGINITSRNQIIRKDGEYYRIAPSATIPYTTTGNWASESSKFVSVGDAALRQELASSGGSAKVEFAGRTVQQKLSDDPSPMDSPYGATGNGATNDTASFVSFEAQVSGRVIDLSGKTFVVDSVPNKNSYINGRFKVGGFTRAALLAQSFTNQPPHYKHFGGQLSKLKESLCNPLEQFTGIVFIGDSITWGTGLGSENAVSTPRDGTLSDPRDYFSTASFVNIVKRYIGSKYFFGAAPVLSNWAASPSGESIAEYAKKVIELPYRGAYTLAASGVSVTNTLVENAGSASGYQLRLSDGNTAGTSSQTISFKFTGYEFTFHFAAVGNVQTSSDYELFVDGVSQGVFTTTPGEDGVVAGTGNTRKHTFGYIKDKTIQIKTKRRTTQTTSVITLYIEALEINKKVRISNQGINGTTANRYRVYNLPPSSYGDGVAVNEGDAYVFVQVGTNDRGTQAGIPKGSNAFLYYYGVMLDAIPAYANQILMCSNPAEADGESLGYSFDMQQVRGVIYGVAKARSLDFIDNYAALQDSDIRVLASDGLHPNVLGFSIMARNIINAIEQS